MDITVILILVGIMIGAIGIRQELIYREAHDFRAWFFKNIGFQNEEGGDDDGEVKK